MTQKVRGFIAICLQSKPMTAHGRGQGRHCGLMRRSGTTLIEIAICIGIVGTGVAALMQFMASATNVNRINVQTAMAIQYARAGWETAVGQGFDKVKMWTVNPPIVAPAFSTPSNGYERRIWVENVNINNITGAAAAGAITDKLRLNVEILANTVLVYKQRWILTKP